jgi:hypothetical protein
MRTTTLVLLAALSSMASPALACKVLARFPQHLGNSSIGWWEPYRIVEIVAAYDEHFIVIVKQSFGDKTDVGKPTALRFVANEEANAICPISLEVGKTYLVRSASGPDPLLISRFDWLNMPSTDPKYRGYLQDLERATR